MSLDQWEAQLRRDLAGGDGADRPGMPPALLDSIRTTGRRRVRRRQAGLVAGAAALVLVIGLGASAGLGRGVDESLRLPATSSTAPPTTAPSWTPTAPATESSSLGTQSISTGTTTTPGSTVGTGTRTIGSGTAAYPTLAVPDGAVHGGLPPIGSQWPATGATSHPARDPLPGGVRLPHEGVPAQGDYSAWALTPWQVPLCSQDVEHFPLLGRARAVRMIQRTGPELQRYEGVAFFPDEATALAFLSDLATAAATCPGNVAPDALGAQTWIGEFQSATSAAWDEGFTVAIAVPTPEGGQYGTQLTTVARVGTAVLVVGRGGEFTDQFRSTAYLPAYDELRDTMQGWVAQVCPVAGGCRS